MKYHDLDVAMEAVKRLNFCVMDIGRALEGQGQTDGFAQLRGVFSNPPSRESIEGLQL
jgi:hypothetical protein